MTLREQLETLRKMGSSGGTIGLKYGVALLTLGLLFAPLVFRHPAYAAALVFFAFVTYSSWQTTPLILYASEAFELGSVSHGIVQISITKWFDSDTCLAFVPADALLPAARAAARIR
jgi:hypothetical protein